MGLSGTVRVETCAWLYSQREMKTHSKNLGYGCLLPVAVAAGSAAAVEAGLYQLGDSGWTAVERC